MEPSSYAFLALGLALVAFSAWCRLGRSEAARYWVGSEVQERTHLMVFPAVGVFFLVAGVMPVAEDSGAGEAIVGFLFFPAVVVAFWGIFLPIPRWSTPGWYRTQTAYRKEARRKAKEEKRRAKRGERTSGDGG